MILKIIFACAIFQQVSSHGWMMDPVSRSSAWRFGFPTPKNYNDNALFCGGFNVSLVVCLGYHIIIFFWFCLFPGCCLLFLVYNFLFAFYLFFFFPEKKNVSKFIFYSISVNVYPWILRL
jgi:hypothetical protein